MSDPLVSVVLTTRDRPDWLSLALQSVLSGEFRDYELIVSNNGDPTHTRALAEKVTDPRIRWIEYRRDSTMLEHFGAALRAATGKYVAILHDDDIWAPRFLSSLVPALEARPDAVLAFADHYIIDVDGRVDPKLTEHYTRRWGRAALAAGYHQPFFGLVARQAPAITSSVYRRDALPTEFAPDLAQFFDIWINFVLAQTDGAAYYHGPERLMSYRVHGESSSAARHLEGFLGAVRYRQRMRDDPRMHEFDDVMRERLARDHLSAGAALMRRRDRVPARSHVAAAMRLRPSAKAASGWVASFLIPGSMLERMWPWPWRWSLRRRADGSGHATYVRRPRAERAAVVAEEPEPAGADRNPAGPLSPRG